MIMLEEYQTQDKWICKTVNHTIDVYQNMYIFQIDMTAFIFLARQSIETVQIPSLLPNSYTLKILQTRQYYEERLEPNQLVSLPWVQIYCYVVYAIIDVIFCYPCNSSGMRILNTYNIIIFQNILVHFPGRKNTNLCWEHKKTIEKDKTQLHCHIVAFCDVWSFNCIMVLWFEK